jgi:hypothetical protein
MNFACYNFLAMKPHKKKGNFLMKFLKRTLQLVFFALLSQSASASFIQISGQALPLNQGLPNQDSYSFRSDDGALTSLQYDTGLLAGNNGTASSAASVDIEQATLRLRTEINGRETASARVGLFDSLFFDLPDGMLSAEITFNFTVEGIFSGIFNGCATCLSATLEFGNALSIQTDQKVIVLAPMALT